MASEHDDTHLRRYLLGELTDEQCVALEEEYFGRPDVLQRVWATENDLIDDYVSGRLAPVERERFERYRLATPGQRARVAVARELRVAVSARRAPAVVPHESNAWWVSARQTLRGWPRVWQAALAAAVLLLAVGAVLLVGVRPRPSTTTADAPSSAPAERPSDRPAADQAKAPGESGNPEAKRASVTVAFSLSPLTVRGADEGPSLIVAPGTDVVVLRLEDDGVGPALGSGRAVVRTVSAGSEIWRGPAAPGGSERPPALARIEIPAVKLPPDDYTVQLFGTDSSGQEAERHRYFLRVR